MPFDRCHCLHCCVIVNERPLASVSCSEFFCITTQTHLAQAKDFSSWVFLFYFFPHLIPLPPLYSGVMCNADSGVRRARSANKCSIFPRLAPSVFSTSTCGETRTYQHFYHLGAKSVCSESLLAFVAWVCAGRSLFLVSNGTKTERGL